MEEKSGISTMEIPFSGFDCACSCSNCCQKLFPRPTADSQCSNDVGIVIDLESYSVYELIQGDQVVAIRSALEKIYRYEQLRDLNDSDEELVESIPLCPNCANILNQMDILRQEFDRLRGLESYLSAKIYQVDEIIRDGIVNLNLQQITKEHQENDDTFGDSSRVDVKIEPEDTEETSETALSLGPWVVLKRLKPETVPDQSQPDPEEDSNLDSFGDNDSDYCPDMDFEANSREEDSKPDIPYEDDFISPKKRRISNRIRKSVVKSFQTSEVAGMHATRKCKTIKSKTIKSKINTSETKNQKPADRCTKARKKGKERKPKFLRNINRRKLSHPYPCYYCLSDFDVELDRVEHVKEIHCTKFHPVICSPCGKIFTSEKGRKHHEPKCNILPPHTGMPPYTCNDCGKEFQSRWYIKLHQKMVHGDSTERPFACDQCEHKSKTAGALGIHKKFVHTDSDKVECPECHKIFKSQPCFEEHFRNFHTLEGNKRYRELIKRVLVKKKEQYRRTQITTSTCSTCNIDFQTVARYKIHLKEVHATSKVWKWQCEQCGMGFNNSWIFRKHQSYVHTDERPFICDQCGMQFKSPSNLQTHVTRAHTEEGRLKYNEYKKEDYKRKQRLAQELLKVKNMECSDGQGALEAPSSSATGCVDND